ncbi:8-amino-7-oxononanoate synthase [Bacterioplanes sanyensis]|uniref:8-amino-7-oxononanoate synthase n=1 Tax=Bacterioplanes sanyensis TaxID=1249553 RepID=A0A222FF19_9GAMM|nr:8-amino-7-oxononanoate synthase [Bacterioplanes sanyensis]ASP37232.1 8-amino-7-oxononanoate synthase [Bacterioplanes sanyensis]
MIWQRRIQQALEQRKAQHLWRQPHCLQGPQGVIVTRGERRLLNFCSNDYLGLAALGGDALQQAAQQWQFGSGASHLVCGHSQAHEELQRALAAHAGYPRAVLFSTGYMANLGVISALTQRGDTVWQDKLNHASLLDGAQLSRAQLKRYRHNDSDHLQQLLATTDGSGAHLIVSDSIFSMDGNCAELTQLANIAEQHQALLLIDDAHGFGVLGEHGEGARHAFSLSAQQLPLYMGTLGKALGGFGAFVACDHDMADYLTQFARSHIYTTAMPPALAAAMCVQLQRLQQGDLQKQLRTNIAYWRQLADQAGLPLMPSESAIQPLLVGSSERALQLSAALSEQGFWVTAIRPPTVPQHSARLRITLSAAHSHEQIAELVSCLQPLWEQCS